MIEIKPGMVFIERGNPKIFTHRLIAWFSGSWYTHGYIAISETEGVEASLPGLPSFKQFNKGSVRKLLIQNRLDWVKSYDGHTVVMDLSSLTDEQRVSIARAAESCIGWKYDLLSVVLYPLFGFWPKFKRKELFCSELMAFAYKLGAQIRLFTQDTLARVPQSNYYRLKNLRDGLCTPDEVFRYSILEEITRI